MDEPEERMQYARSTFGPLVCVECRTMSDEEARGWRTYLTEDGEGATFCPNCAGHEFGQ